jgi:hypothetical protein
MPPEWICNNGAVYEGEHHENEQSPPVKPVQVRTQWFPLFI